MSIRNRRSLYLAATIAAAACTSTPAHQTPAPGPAKPAPKPVVPVIAPQTSAVATIRDTAGKTVGNATLVDTYAGVLVTGTVSDLGVGAHGIHIHAVGKCEAPFTSAGGHFNPSGKQHGFRNANGPHLGDMPNIDTPPVGALHFEAVLPGVTLRGQNALLDADGAAIVVHAARDDYTTDPSGNSGGRIACGVITQR